MATTKREHSLLSQSSTRGGTNNAFSQMTTHAAAALQSASRPRDMQSALNTSSEHALLSRMHMQRANVKSDEFIVVNNQRPSNATTMQSGGRQTELGRFNAPRAEVDKQLKEAWGNSDRRRRVMSNTAMASFRLHPKPKQVSMRVASLRSRAS